MIKTQETFRLLCLKKLRLPFSPEPVTSPYSEPDESNPVPKYFRKIHFNIILGIPGCIFPPGF
jgi:hypothetical protein